MFNQMLARSKHLTNGGGDYGNANKQSQLPVPPWSYLSPALGAVRQALERKETVQQQKQRSPGTRVSKSPDTIPSTFDVVPIYSSVIHDSI